MRQLHISAVYLRLAFLALSYSVTCICSFAATDDDDDDDYDAVFKEK